MKGWWTVGSFRGAPIRIHWSAPLGALLFGGLAFRPGFWVAFIVVVLLHELGHAAVVRASGHRVVGVDVHGLGGECRWSGEATPIAAACIAWGGVWAQLVLAAAAFTFTLFLPPPFGFVGDFMRGLVVWNLYMAAFNLLPIPPLDGATAWRLPGLLLARRRARKRLAARPRARVLPFVKPTKAPPRETFEVEIDDDAPLSEEAKRVVEIAAEIARRAAKSEKEKKS